MAFGCHGIGIQYSGIEPQSPFQKPDALPSLNGCIHPGRITPLSQRASSSQIITAGLPRLFKPRIHVPSFGAEEIGCHLMLFPEVFLTCRVCEPCI